MQLLIGILNSGVLSSIGSLPRTWIASFSKAITILGLILIIRLKPISSANSGFISPRWAKRSNGVIYPLTWRWLSWGWLFSPSPDLQPVLRAIFPFSRRGSFSIQQQERRVFMIPRLYDP